MRTPSNKILRKCNVSHRRTPLKGTPRRMEKESRISLVLTRHLLNNIIKRIMLYNFNIISKESATKEIFPQSPMIAYHRDRNLRNILVHTSDTNQTTPRVGPAPCRHPCCKSCNHKFDNNTRQGPKGSLTIRETFTCGHLALYTASSAVAALHALLGNDLANISGVVQRMHPVFPSQSTTTGIDTLRKTRKFAASSPAVETGKGNGRRCVSYKQTTIKEGHCTAFSATGFLLMFLMRPTSIETPRCCRAFVFFSETNPGQDQRVWQPGDHLKGADPRLIGSRRVSQGLCTTQCGRL